MSFNNRWVCQTDQNYELENIIIELQKNNHYIIQSEESNNDLHHRVRVNPDIIETDTVNFIYGEYGYQYEKEFNSVAIVNEEEMILRPDTLMKTNILNFWITDNGKILFSKSGAESSIGKDKFSELLFDNDLSINTVNFDIEELGAAVINNIFRGMWVSSFRDRNGNIEKGSHFGRDIEEDPMYGETEGCTKNSVGFEVEVDNEFRKLRVNRKGTMQFLGTTILPNHVRIFDVLNDLENYILYDF